MARRRALPAAHAALCAFLCAVFAILTAPSAGAKPQRFGIVRHLPITAPALMLQGEIAAGDDAQLRAALAAFPETRYLVLDSSGGLIEEALRMSRTIRDHDLATFIPPKGICASACALLWMSGDRRQAAGRLGVHRFATRGGLGFFADEARIQDRVGEIVELLNDSGVPPFVLVPMLRTPNAEVHWFTVTEMGLLRAGDPMMWKTARDINGAISVGSHLSSSRPRNAAEPRKATPVNPEPQSQPAVSDVTGCSSIPDATAQALCRDPHLAGLDADLTAATHRAGQVTTAADMPAFLEDMTAWDRTRAACRGNIACLERAYSERLEEVLPGTGGAP